MYSVMQCAEKCANSAARFWEWLAEIWPHGAILGWATKHFESDSQNEAGLFLHNSVEQKTV